MRQSQFFVACAASCWACGGNVALSTGASDDSAITGGTAFGGSSSVPPQATGGANAWQYPGGMSPVSAELVAEIAKGSCVQVTSFLSPSSCTITVPHPGFILIPSRVSVIYHVNGDLTYDLQLIGQTLDSCPNGDGWFIEASGTELVYVSLCAKTCTAIHTDNNPLISVYVGCAMITN